MENKYHLEDLSGERIDYITFIKKEKCSDNGHARYLCRCDCGNEFIKRKDLIMKMRIKSCGCKSARKTPIKNSTKSKAKGKNKTKDHTDLSGKQYGRLTVLECIGSDKHHKRLYRCLCECGKEKITTQALLKRGEVTSCGCKQKEVIFKQNGLSTKRIYAVYNSMKIRCYNKKFKQYKDYGGRGIAICPEWLGENGFINFYNWAMENGYKDNLTLDRINPKGNYEPSNCRWATYKEQANNTKATVFLTYNGETKPASEWAEIVGISQSAITHRKSKGWTDEECLTVKNHGRRKMG